jgi:hypothetical protein
MWSAAQQMNDYHMIKFVDGAYRKLAPRDTELKHVRSLNWLQDALTVKQDQKTVVVTHHVPSR